MFVGEILVNIIVRFKNKSKTKYYVSKPNKVINNMDNPICQKPQGSSS
jgi:hypothetical protein